MLYVVFFWLEMFSTSLLIPRLENALKYEKYRSIPTSAYSTGKLHKKASTIKALDRLSSFFLPRFCWHSDGHILCRARRGSFDSPLSGSDFLSCSVSVRDRAELARLVRQELCSDLRPRIHMCCMPWAGDGSTSGSVSTSEPTPRE